MDEVKFSQTELTVVEQIKSGGDFEAICQKSALSSHSVQAVLSAIVRKLRISHPEILAIKQFCDKQ